MQIVFAKRPVFRGLGVEMGFLKALFVPASLFSLSRDHRLVQFVLRLGGP
jgi:hypothetical protein